MLESTSKPESKFKMHNILKTQDLYAFLMQIIN